MDPRSTSDKPFAPAPSGSGSGPDLDDDLDTEPVVPGPVTRRGGSGSARWVNVALGAALVLAVGGVAFAAGRLTAPASAAAGANGEGRFQRGEFGGQFPGGYGFPGGGQGGFGGARGISLEGTVEAVSGDTITLKLANGQTIQVSLTGTTAYHLQSSATASDVTNGKTVIVRVQGFRPDGQTGQAGGGATATDVTVVP